MNRSKLTPEMVRMKLEGMPYAAIAEMHGVTRQRIQQVFSPRKKGKIAVAARARALCEMCGAFDQFGHFHHKEYTNFETLNSPDNIIYLCASCHTKLTTPKQDWGNCKVCGNSLFSRQQWRTMTCSASCRHIFLSVSVICSCCGSPFVLSPSNKIRLVKSQTGLLFCSKQCQGKYAAAHWGFGAHPENIRGGSAENEAMPKETASPQEGR